MVSSERISPIKYYIWRLTQRTFQTFVKESVSEPTSRCVIKQRSIMLVHKFHRIFDSQEYDRSHVGSDNLSSPPVSLIYPPGCTDK